MCVLLDNFVQAVKNEKQKVAEQEERRRRAQLVSRNERRATQEKVEAGQPSQRPADLENPLNPLLESLCKFKDSVRPTPPNKRT
jgi:hypothetical protein